MYLVLLTLIRDAGKCAKQLIQGEDEVFISTSTSIDYSILSAYSPPVTKET